jgi:hypothetical protein
MRVTDQFELKCPLPLAGLLHLCLRARPFGGKATFAVHYEHVGTTVLASLDDGGGDYRLPPDGVRCARGSPETSRPRPLSLSAHSDQPRVLDSAACPFWVALSVVRFQASRARLSTHAKQGEGVVETLGASRGGGSRGSPNKKNLAQKNSHSHTLPPNRSHVCSRPPRALSPSDAR